MIRAVSKKLLGACAAAGLMAGWSSAQDLPPAPPLLQTQLIAGGQGPLAPTPTMVQDMAPSPMAPGAPVAPGCRGCAPPAPELPSICGPCVGPLSYLYVDFMYLARDVDNEKILLGFESAGQVGTFRLREDAFNFEPALRVTYGQALTNLSACDLFLEAGYLGLHHSNVTLDAPLFPGVTYFGSQFPPVMRNVFTQRVDYVSDLHSGEINLKWDYFVNRQLFLLAGVRFFRFDDRYKVFEEGQTRLDANGALANSNAFRSVRVTDNLIGLQVGFDWHTNDSNSRTQFGIFGKAGVYGNFAESEIEQIVTVGPQGTPLASFATPGRTKGAGVIEGGFVSTIQLGPQFYLRGGYQFLWLGHIAVAPDQATPDLITGVYNAKLRVNDDVFFHGPFAGIEWRWGCCR